MDTPAPTGTLIELLQCSKQRCLHVLLETEREWLPRANRPGTKDACCPKCFGNSFYTLNAQGQIRRHRDEGPREIRAEDIEPSARMGLKMKRRLLAAKRRALGNPPTQLDSSHV